MFLIQQIQRVGLGRYGEGLKRLQWIHGLMAQHPGSSGTLLARFLGNPTDILVLRWWQDRAAFDDFMQGPGGQYPQSRPAGIYVGLPVGANWNLVGSGSGTAQGNLLLRSGYSLQPEKWADFLRCFEQTQRLAGWLGSLVEMHDCRNVDEALSALVLTRLRDRSALEELMQSPSQVAIESEIESFATPTFAECYEVVHETHPWPKKD